jgi:hypothetical protein
VENREALLRELQGLRADLAGLMLLVDVLLREMTDDTDD